MEEVVVIVVVAFKDIVVLYGERWDDSVVDKKGIVCESEREFA